MRIFYKKHLSLYLGILCLLLFSAAFTQGQTPESDIVKGKIRVKLKEELFKTSQLRVSSDTKNDPHIGIEAVDAVSDEISNEIGLIGMKRVFPFSSKYEERHRKHNLHLWYELTFDPAVDPYTVMKKYEGLPEIEIVKPVYKKARIDADRKPVLFRGNTRAESNSSVLEPAFFNDPLLPEQWHYENDGSLGQPAFDIDLFSAWQKNTGNAEVIVAVVDQGVDFNHEDLKGNMWKNEAELNGLPGVDDDKNGYVDDIYGYNFLADGAITPGPHGTHVAGTVGATSNNGVGLSGVAGGDGTGNGIRLMSCQVFDSNGDAGNFAEAIVYSADNGAVISQNSWGYNIPDYYEPEIIDAIAYFIEEAGQFPGSPMKGGILFFASGNTGTQSTRYPGAFDNVIAVTSVGPTGLPTNYSTYGPWTDIAGPGGDMQSFGDEGGVLSTLPGNAYGYLEGTSMACPHVSGVAALVVSQFGGFGFTADDLRRIILSSSLPFGQEGYELYGRGYVNAQRAMLDDNRIPPNAISDLSATDIFHNQVQLNWTVPEDPDGNEPSDYFLAISENVITSTSFNGEAIYTFPNTVTAGQTYSLKINGLRKEKSYWFAIKSADQFENLSDISNVLMVTTASEPNFMSSTRTVEVMIDVTESAVATQSLSFSNIGEGRLSWESTVFNEQYVNFSESSTINNVITIDQPQTEDSTSLSSGAADTFVYIESLGITDHSTPNSYWKNDVTEFVAGMTHDNGTDPAILAGSGNPNSGFIVATRFDLPRDYGINVTHVEAVMYPDVNDKPILVEIRKGGRNNFEESESVYFHEYYPDTVKQLKYYRIPIYRPQWFEDGESFWVVLHYPKENSQPQAMQLGFEDYWGKFIISRDNGRNYQDASALLFRPVIPMVSAMSTGNDGSYVFLDPASGTLSAAESAEVDVIIDANNLTNGPHLASLGIRTNDIHKPIMNIEVKVQITGHHPEPDLTERVQLEAYVNRTNELEFSVENKGLGSLEIYGINSSDPVLVKNFSDTILIGAGDTGTVPFLYTPSSEGTFNPEFILQTNIGLLPASIQIMSVEEPLLMITANESVFNLTEGTTAELKLILRNTSSGAVLNYDLNAYSTATKNAGILPEKFSYTITDSENPDGPPVGMWNDISAYGRQASDFIPLELKLPYFDQSIEAIELANFGNLYAYGNSLIVPLRLQGYAVSNKEITYYGFGDRTIINFLCEIRTGNLPIGEVEYQVVLYRDGSIEFRYSNVDLISDMDYSVWIEGVEFPDKYAYREFGEPGKPMYNGKVIRFEPSQIINMLGDATPASGSLLPGGEESVILQVDPDFFGVVAGTYINEVQIKTNSFSGIHSLPVTVHISGNPDLSNSDSVNFETINVGQEVTGYVQFTNEGLDKIEIQSFSVADPAFMEGVELPQTIEAKSTYMFPINFQPERTGEFDLAASFAFSDNSSSQVALKGNVSPDPSYAHTIPDNIQVEVTGGSKVRIPFNLENTNPLVALDYKFENSRFVAADSTPSGLALGSNKSPDFEGIYGYTTHVSEKLGADYKWNDIRIVGEVVTPPDGTHYKIDLPFSFPYYGDSYNTIWVSNKGYVTVIEPLADPENASFEMNDGVRGMIAPFWSDIVPPSDNGGLFIEKFEDRIYLQWENYKGRNSNISGGDVTFQLEITDEGFIYFHYKRVDDWGGLVKYGLESPDESEVVEDPLAIIVSYAPFTDETTYSLIPPLKGTLDVAETLDLNLVISAENIFVPGVYRDSLVLRTNSKVQEDLIVPVELHVIGSPVLTRPDTLAWEEVVFRDGLKISQEMVLSNSGHDILLLENLKSDNLGGVEFLDQDGNRIIRNGSGNLLNPIRINPWEQVKITVSLPVPQQSDLQGSILLAGNFGNQSVHLKADIVPSPVFNWDASDQVFDLLETETQSFSFSIQNEGLSRLRYQLVPAVVPDNEESDSLRIIDEIGHFSGSSPITIDSLARDWNEKADAVFTPWVVGPNLSFANSYVAPENGFYITHIKTYNYLDKINEYVRISIYVDGDLPEEGQLVYDEKFVIDRVVDEEWIYFPLKEPFVIPAGKKFFIAVAQPVSSKYMGYDVSTDEEKLKYTFSGVYTGNDSYYWYPSSEQSEKWVWKIRPLTAAGENQWLELDAFNGDLLPGRSAIVNALIDPLKAGSGVHSAKLLVKSNDVNRSSDQFSVTINVNGAPRFEFYPNMYEEQIEIQETEKRTLNYLFSDPENDVMTLKLGDIAANTPEITLQQTGDISAQLTISTGYEDAGEYVIPVVIMDDKGNEVYDAVIINVIDKNRPPVFNEEFSEFQLNLAGDGSLTIDPFELFYDPDGDDLQIYAGNYTPQILDMALGSRYISLIPREIGTAQLVFAADDGKENGYVLNESFVQVIDDPDAAEGETSDNGLKTDIKGEYVFSVQPNPVTNGQAKLVYYLENTSNVKIIISDLQGRVYETIDQSDLHEGSHSTLLNLSKVPRGMILCTLWVNESVSQTFKLIIR
ncbi:S8 family serine peptidase [Fulvivirga sedimenti]|uniref:S8 family serine peptidase n=1 Tax=Fulvivirga sedimenti TaxID=2879465 RepID=A0A9X1KW33_9BACT|nr:S8 family serine peptidase [Fulvivirga sedimenti]MCA6074315.1 S8 family serine peptidase [Fulvivirga sedimenti]